MGEHEDTHAEPTNEEIQKRIKIPSHFLASPYTDPCRDRRYRRDQVLVYNPLRKVPKEKKDAFDKYMGSTEETLIRCGLEDRSKKFFTEILTLHFWLFSEVCNMIMLMQGLSPSILVILYFER